MLGLQIVLVTLHGQFAIYTANAPPNTLTYLLIKTNRIGYNSLQYLVHFLIVVVQSIWHKQSSLLLVQNVERRQTIRGF